MDLTDKMADMYIDDWKTMRFDPERKDEIGRLADRAYRFQDKYLEVANEFKMPWQVVAAIHLLEASGDFSRHLHNGDPLSSRTKHVPEGRPLKGEPPFDWVYSAKDALSMTSVKSIVEWDIPHTLYFLEGYNGWGYRTLKAAKLAGVNSPYLWSFTQHYRCGKFISDGRYSMTAKSQQCGACPILASTGFTGIQ